MREHIEKRIQQRDAQIGIIAFRRVCLEKEIEQIDEDLAVLSSANEADGHSLKDFDTFAAVKDAEIEEAKREVRDAFSE